MEIFRYARWRLSPAGRAAYKSYAERARDAAPAREGVRGGGAPGAQARRVSRARTGRVLAGAGRSQRRAR